MGWIAAVLFALSGGLWLLQRRLIYLPSGSVPPVGEVLPGWEEVALDTADGISLRGWFRAPAGDEPVVVVCNGNAGNRSLRAPLGARLAAAGLGVLLFDYRGYGGNPGRPTETGLAADAAAAVRYVAGRAPGAPLVYFGESLGAAVAVGVALDRPPAALILRSPFTSLADVAAVHYPFLPARRLLWDAYPTLERIGRVRTRCLVVAGADDTIVPAAQSRAVYDAAPEPKEYLLIEGAGHNDLAVVAGRQLVATVVRFIDDATR